MMKFQSFIASSPAFARCICSEQRARAQREAARASTASCTRRRLPPIPRTHATGSSGPTDIFSFERRGLVCPKSIVTRGAKDSAEGDRGTP